jgi:hypothetical protein
VLFSCTPIANIKNEKAGQLTATHQLVESSEKKVLLDNESAPKPPYMQMIKSADGGQVLTFLNPYKNAIYFYDYENIAYVGRIEYEKEGPNGILSPTGYYVQNMDSIYVYNMPMTEVVLTDSTGIVKQRISLRGDERKDWYSYFPQYILSTSINFIKIKDKLLLTGLLARSIPSQMIDDFRFTACIDMKTTEVEYMYTYPKELYGYDYNWEGGLATSVFPELSPSGEIIHSFAVSHNLYITPWNSNDYKIVYAGGNNVSTIRSINWGEFMTTPLEVMQTYYATEDMYAAIHYDLYRKVYYRILLQGIPDATVVTDKEEKPVVVIIMDEQFNYMGETVLGPWQEWNWQNSFVTPEGLVMEYFNPDLDSEEEYLTLKTFAIEKM